MLIVMLTPVRVLTRMWNCNGGHAGVDYEQGGVVDGDVNDGVDAGIVVYWCCWC